MRNTNTTTNGSNGTRYIRTESACVGFALGQDCGEFVDRLTRLARYHRTVCEFSVKLVKRDSQEGSERGGEL